jgi:hypothetical protein
LSSFGTTSASAHARDAELARVVDERSPVDVAVNELVEEVVYALVELRGFHVNLRKKKRKVAGRKARGSSESSHDPAVVAGPACDS